MPSFSRDPSAQAVSLLAIEAIEAAGRLFRSGNSATIDGRPHIRGSRETRWPTSGPERRPRVRAIRYEGASSPRRPRSTSETKTNDAARWIDTYIKREYSKGKRIYKELRNE